jgi:hypothetical protein
MILEEQLQSLGYTLQEQFDNEKIYSYRAEYCSNLITYNEGRVRLKLCVANVGIIPASGVFEDFETFRKWFFEYTTQ